MRHTLLPTATLGIFLAATTTAWADDSQPAAQAAPAPAQAAEPAATPAEPVAGGAAQPPPPDVAQNDGANRPNPPERGFLFAVEPSVPEQWHAVVSAGMGNVTRTGEERPIGSGPIVPTFGAELGLYRDRISFYAEGGVVSIDQGNPGQLASPFILDTGVHILLTDPTSRTWRLSLRPSYSHDVDNSSTANLTATLAWYHKGFRAISSAMVSHTFQSDADIVDLQATLGLTYDLPFGFRVGVEGVVADLEEIGCTVDNGYSGCGAEDGSSAYAGPTAGWNWDRFQVVLGPAWGTSPGAAGTFSNPNDSLLFRAAAIVRL